MLSKEKRSTKKNPTHTTVRPGLDGNRREFLAYFNEPRFFEKDQPAPSIWADTHWSTRPYKKISGLRDNGNIIFILQKPLVRVRPAFQTQSVYKHAEKK